MGNVTKNTNFDELNHFFDERLVFGVHNLYFHNFFSLLCSCFQKNIKRAGKILWIFVVVVVSTPTVLFFAINSGWVQNRVAQHVTATLSEKLGNHISTGNIRVKGFNRVEIRDLLVTGVHGDTILAVPELSARLNLLAFSMRNIEVRKVVLHRADIRFAIEPEIDAINIKFIVDQLKSKDTATNKPKWFFGIRSIELNDSHFTFKNETKTFDRPFGMDYAGLEVSNLNLAVSHFHIDDSLGGVKFRIRRLSCVEKCGIDVRFMSADFWVNRNNLSFKNVYAKTSLSGLEANEVSFHFDSWEDFSGDSFISKVAMNVDIRASDVAFSDLSQFVPYFGTYTGKAMVSGTVTGTVENMKGVKIVTHFGDKTQIAGNFDLKGLPKIRTTLIYADVSDLVTCPQDIEQIQVPKSPAGHVVLPAAMQKITAIGFKGNFTGFFDDFVTYGTFTSNLGNLSTDVSIKPLTGVDTDTTFTFRGALKTERFHLGKLLTQPAIGEITLTGMVEGSASRSNIHAFLEGNVENFDLKGYEYRNIAINGTVDNRIYDGQLRIDEPNIKMDFSGKVDLTEEIPAYDFWANVERARLYNLKLVEKDTSSFAAFTIQATFSGTNIDNLSGDLDLKNSLLRRKSREIEINNLLLFTKEIRDTNQFILRSDIFDAEIRGQYQFLKLPESFFSMVKNFAPAWVPATVSPDSLSNNSFRFEAKFKETEKLTHFFMDEFYVSRGTQIDGVYDPLHRDFHFVLNVPFMGLNGKQWQGFYMNGSVEDSTFLVESGCEVFRLNKNLSFEHLTVMARARGDSVGMDLRWNNWDSVLNRGSLSSKMFFLKKPKQQIPLIKIYSLPGQIVTAGDIWKITHQGITIDSTAVRIDNIQALRSDQEIQVSGVISQREQDELDITVKDLNLSVINSSMQFDKLLFGGIANGSASLSNLYGVPVFVSDLRVDSFSLNNSLFGSTCLMASWNSASRSVRVDAESNLNGLRTMYARGNYFISNQALDFDVSLKKVPAKILQPYLENVFTGLEGALSSEMKLTGSIQDPLMNGSIEMHQTALTLDYTKTRYNFAGTATVKNNNISFKDIELFDRFNNSCRINAGYISIERFRDITFDLQFQANNLEVLNTGVRDNDLFYGRAFASGSILIRGNPKNMKLDIIARTDRNTRFFVPLSSNDALSKTSFITFVDHTPRAQKRLTDFQRRRNTMTANDEPVREETKFAVNITMDVTPDAEVQLIFDAKIGDIIRARGNGNLKLNITNSRFDMAGTYAVEEGDYLFTLQNLLSNKHFSIEKGGIITWSGDPLGALLNLKAIYTARPSLYDLMKDENFKRSVPVLCILHITNKMTNPNIRFELDIPSASQEVMSFLSAATASEEEMSQQFIFLVAANRFYPNMSQTGGSPGGLETMGLATASEFLTGQLSHMISQWSEDFDFDFSVRPGTYNTGQVYEGGFTTRGVNFRMNYEVATETSDNVGEFSLDTKVGNSNKFRFKVFNRANATYLTQSAYTQGVGILFREDFNQVRDLFKRKQSPAIRREEEEETIETKNEKSATVSIKY